LKYGPSSLQSELRPLPKARCVVHVPAGLFRRKKSDLRDGEATRQVQEFVPPKLSIAFLPAAYELLRRHSRFGSPTCDGAGSSRDIFWNGTSPAPGGTSPVPSPRAVNDPSSVVSTPTFVIDGSFRKGLAISKSSNSKNTSTHHPADIRALDRKVIPRQEGVCDGSFDATTPPHRCHGTSSGEAAPSSRPEESGNSEKDRRKLILVHCQCSKRKRHPSTAPLLRLLPSFVLLGACGRHLVPAGKVDLRGRRICA
jgi:hypothetical protein